MREWLLLGLGCLLSACGSSGDGGNRAVDAPPPAAFDGALVSDAAARVAHGRRIARVLGCNGCHGADLQGERFYELYASNLTLEVPKYSDEQLDRLLRAGEHPTGRDVWGMPSEIFQHLADPDVASLLAYLRTLKPAGAPTQPRLPFKAETRKMIADGKLMPAARWVAMAGDIAPPDLGPRHVLGRYLTMVTCAECHGPDLEGGEGTPDLLVAGGYSRDDFETLMTTGVPVGGGLKLGLMADVARGRFRHMTRHERDALYAYLKARAERGG